MPARRTPPVHTHATNVEELREEGIYQFLSPDQAINRIRETGALSLHPLCGGMPIDSAWQSLELTVDKVLPAVAEA